MRRTLPLLMIALLGCGAASAAALKPGDRELSVELGYSDLDLGQLGPFDLGSADGPRAALSISWVRTRVIHLGIRAAVTDFESDSGESIEGAALGGLLRCNIPTGGKATPFVAVGVSVPFGNLNARYDYSYGVSVGVGVYLSPRFGFSLAAEYEEYKGEEFVPAADATSFAAGFLYKF